MVWKRKTKHVVHTPYTQLPIKMFAIRNFAEIICAISREISFVSLVSLQCTILQRCDYCAALMTLDILTWHQAGILASYTFMHHHL